MVWMALASAAANYASKSGQQGGGGAASGAQAGHSGPSKINVGGLEVPDYPGGGFDLSNPTTAIMTAAGVLIFGAILLRAVR